MNEEIRIFNKNNQHIFGILHKPDIIHDEFNRVIIIFLHGWAGYRTGPHDLFVKISRKLAKEGFYSLRFDFGGKGYSQGNTKNVTLHSMQTDLHQVLNEINQDFKASKIILTGICTGAKVGLDYT
ncbi:MAG: alpha/beta fold hydrolase, partial [Candidatus Thorarchaeota archaeon]